MISKSLYSNYYSSKVIKVILTVSSQFWQLFKNPLLAFEVNNYQIFLFKCNPLIQFSIIIFLFMLSVAPQQFELPRDQVSMDSAPTFQFQESEVLTKQQEKKSLFTPYKILLGLAIFFILVMASYKVYSSIYAPAAKSEINNLHGKIIQNADGSSKDKGSSSGSSSSKSSKSNDKPLSQSKTTTKTPIYSGASGASESSGSGDQQEQDKNNGDKNKKTLDSGKNSQTGKSKDSTSTDQDSDSVQEQDSADISNENLMMWSNKDDGPTPLIGSARD